MSIDDEIEFNNIVNDILKNEEFIELKYEIHHGISRLDHSLSVAHLTYRIARFLRIKKYKEITRAALLHDFFKSIEVPENSFVKHPLVAAKNAKEVFEIDRNRSLLKVESRKTAALKEKRLRWTKRAP